MKDNKIKKLVRELVATIYAEQYMKKNPECKDYWEDIKQRVTRKTLTTKGRKEILNYFQHEFVYQQDSLFAIKYLMKLLGE